MFKSEVHRLDWLIRQVEGHMRNRSIDPPSPELLDVFVVAGSWLDAGLNQAKAILLLLTQDLSAAVGPLQRALWELWIEWRYFLKHGDRALNAAKVMLNARLEALEFLEARPGKLDPATAKRLRREIGEFELQHPHASARIREQRRTRKYHWSGISRSEMERALAHDSTIYRVLSWDAHAVMGPIRDVRIDKKDESDINRHAWTCGGVLFYMYSDFAQMWGLPRVVLRNARA